VPDVDSLLGDIFNDLTALQDTLPEASRDQHVAAHPA
jgi:hypothetical protein